MNSVKSLLLIILIIASCTLNAQHAAVKTYGPYTPITRTKDVKALSDGTVLCLLYSYNTAIGYSHDTYLLHLSAHGDSLERFQVGNARYYADFTGLYLRNDSVFLTALTTGDSLLPHYSEKGVLLNTYCVTLYPLRTQLLSSFKIETDDAVINLQYKALNWSLRPEISYDAEICKLTSDTGSGYLIDEPGIVTVKQLLPVADGGLYVLGDVVYNHQGEDHDLFVLKLNHNLEKEWQTVFGLSRGEKREGVAVQGSEREEQFITTVITDGDTAEVLETRIVGDTVTGHTVEEFRGACSGENQSIAIAASVRYPGIYNMQLLVLHLDAKGNVTGTYAPVNDKGFVIASGILPMKKSWLIYGSRNASNNKWNSEMFTLVIDNNGNKIHDSYGAITGRSAVAEHACKTVKGFFLAGCHYDNSTFPRYAIFGCRVNSKGKLR
jgi:hypothetical protein